MVCVVKVDCAIEVPPNVWLLEGYHNLPQSALTTVENRLNKS